MENGESEEGCVRFYAETELGDSVERAAGILQAPLQGMEPAQEGQVLREASESV